MKKTLLSLLALTLLSTTVLAKPFLIQGKLPHLSGTVKMFWDDKDFALTDEQKTKLIEVRKYTMKNAKALGKQINKLEAEVVQESNNGAEPKLLKAKVSKLASLRARATMIHLNCIYNTRKILTEDQLYILE